MLPNYLEHLISKLPLSAQATVRGIVSWFSDQLSQRDKQISTQQARIRELEAQLNQHSGNSSRPPSSDTNNKPRKNKSKTTSKKSKRKRGGQTGHKGHTLKMVPSDEATITDHYPSTCDHCGNSLSDESSLSYDRSQVFDIPPMSIEVTEHRAHYKTCGCCHQVSQAELPSYASNHAVYGPNLRAMVVYLMGYQMLPYERCVELLEAMFGIRPSVGTLDNILSQADQNLDEFMEQVGIVLQQTDVAGFDETVVRAENAQRYVHVARSDQHTLFHLGRRDYQTMNQMGILTDFKGIAVHDRYANYFGYDCQHALCNAHLLRDLQAVIDRYPKEDGDKSRWAEHLQALLRKMNQAVKRAKEQGKTEFSASHLAQYRQRYRYLIEQGMAQHPAKPPDDDGTTVKQSKAHNLLIALDRYTDEVLHFAYDFRVPFDNNGAERDIRMLKVKMKISGFFHSLQTGNRFMRIRSFISTATKQGHCAWKALAQLFTDNQNDFVLNLVAIKS